MNKGILTYKKIDETGAPVLACYNGRGNIYKYIEEYDKAIANYNLCYEGARKMGLEKYMMTPTANIGHVYLIQGNYAGLSVLEKKEGQWQLKNRINGFDYSGKFLEVDKENTLWINHEYKGLFKLKVDEEFKNIRNVAIDMSLIHIGRCRELERRNALWSALS